MTSSQRACFPTFFLDGTTWQPHDYLYGYGWSHDFNATSESLGDLDGRAIVTAGPLGGAIIRRRASPLLVISGRVSPEVVEISLLQGGTVVRRPISNHFGAWVVCSREPRAVQHPGPRPDGRGAVVGSIHRATRASPSASRDAGGTDDGLRREEHDHGQPSSGHSSCLSCPSTCDDSISFRAGSSPPTLRAQASPSSVRSFE